MQQPQTQAPTSALGTLEPEAGFLMHYTRPLNQSTPSAVGLPAQSPALLLKKLLLSLA